MLETLDYTIRIGSTPTFLYFDLYLYSAYTAHFVYFFFSCVSYVPDPEDSVLLKTALAIYRKFNCYPEALKIAIQLNDTELIKEVFLSCSGRFV